MVPKGLVNRSNKLKFITLVSSFIFSYFQVVSGGDLRQAKNGNYLVSNFQTNWEEQLETGLIALEANCDENYIPFNRERVRDELKTCLKKVLNEEMRYQVSLSADTSLKPEDIFRHIYIEPICSKFSQSLTCLQPHRKIIDGCAREDGRALQQLLEVACRGNGTRLVKFVTAGGIDCISQHREEIASCFVSLAEKKSSLNSSTEVCGYFRESRDCLMRALFKCDKKEPSEIIHGLLEQVVRDTSGNCLTTALPSTGGTTNTLFTNSYLLAFSIFTIILTKIS